MIHKFFNFIINYYFYNNNFYNQKVVVSIIYAQKAIKYFLKVHIYAYVCVFVVCWYGI